MPWTVKRDPEGCSEQMPWSVVKLNDGKIVGCHATEDDALAQVAALYASEDETNADMNPQMMLKLRAAREYLDEAIEMHQMYLDDPGTATPGSQITLMNLLTAAREALGGGGDDDEDEPDMDRQAETTNRSEDPEMTEIAAEEEGAVTTTSEEEQEQVSEEEIEEIEVEEEPEAETEEETEEVESEEDEEPEGEIEETQGNRSWATARISDVPPAEISVTKVVRNDQRRLPESVQARLQAQGLDVGVVDRVARGLFELRFRPEFRFNDDGSVFLHGYATVYGHPYEVMGGPPYGWVETIAHRACDVSVTQGADVRLLINHDGMALARTKSGTLRLESDDVGLYSCAPNLDMRSPTVQSLVSAMQRGDMDEMSFAFRAIQQDWNDDYTERQITEVKLYDVSVVTYPANPATVTSLRAEPKPSIPVGLAQAQADRLRRRSRG